MKSALLAFPLLAATLFGAVPTAAAATSVPARGSVTSSIVSFTPVSTHGDELTFDITLFATFSGTLEGTSLAHNRCVEQLSTGQAHCTGPEVFTGTVAGSRTGTLTFFDTYFFNLKTTAFSGHSSIISGTVDVRGVVNFSGVGPTATYSGNLELVH
jgi:hypothetical protein